MQNVPTHLTETILQSQLLPYLQWLSIETWSCQKPKNKNFANLTFLHIQDANVFLRNYGNARKLQISGNFVRCRVSNRGPPDPFLLKSLHKTAVERQSQKQRPPPPEVKVFFPIMALSCGSYDYSADGRLMYAPEVDWTTSGGEAKFAKFAVIVTFNSPVGRKRIEIPYRIVDNMVISSAACTLTLTLWESPRFFHIEDPSLSDMLGNLSLKNAPRTQKLRLDHLSDGTRDHHEVVGQVSVYKLFASPKGFIDMVRRVKDRDILTIHHQEVSTSTRLESLPYAYKMYDACVLKLSRLVPFNVLYQMEALVRNGYLFPATVTILLRKWIEHSSRSNSMISSAALRKLFRQIPFAGVGVEASIFDPDEIWEYVLENEKEVKSGLSSELTTEKGRHNLVPIHKVTVTPTRVTLHGPEPEAKNRILRRFPEHTDYFIRVQFAEEDGSDIQFNSNVNNDHIDRRFKSIFRDGITVGGRTYGFLGFSHSSLRNHSAWFMAPFYYQNVLHSYVSVINFLGNTENIYSPARRAARIGQAFSETPHHIDLTKHKIQTHTVEDVKSPDGKRVFSDGVGMISNLVMDAINAAIPGRKSEATCFQIRWGGAKGMLALDPRLDGHNVMCIRPSMRKFGSNDTQNLEICDTAKKPIPFVLNRQLIKILEDMGVPAKWFLEEQGNALYRLRLVTANVANTSHFLRRQNIASRIGFPNFLRRLERLGLDYRRDRFLSLIVESAVLRELRLLKHKARIPIEQAVTLFGILDETGYLAEGEVYVTFDEADYVDDHYLDLNRRRVIVTRSPALHPGDVQLAINVVPPPKHPLRRLRNCVVFSQRGNRDLPSCLSGGDLDGDVYGIIWDKSAVQGVRRTFEPADYPRVEPINIGRHVTTDDMTDFFIKFMATDQLGLIAIRHIILADQRDEGTVDPDCLKLAEMHSTGVDYSKTGIPVDMTQFKALRMNKYRPDFISPAPIANLKNRAEIVFDAPTAPAAMTGDEDDDTGPNHMYYISDKVLGQLYRGIDERKIWFDNIKINKPAISSIWRELLEYVRSICEQELEGITWDEFKSEAWEIRHAYEDAMWSETSDFSDHAYMQISEVEVFTGTIFNKTGTQTRRQRDRSVKLRDSFDQMAKWTEAMIRKRNLQTMDDDEEGEHAAIANPDEALKLSIACLHVGMLKDLKTKGYTHTDGEFQSFKVMAACCAMRELDAALKRKSLRDQAVAAGGVAI